MMFSFPRLTFPYFQRRVYVFDLDETLLSVFRNTGETKEYLRGVLKSPTEDNFNLQMLHSCLSPEDGLISKVDNPYSQFYNANDSHTQFCQLDCYALFKQRIAALMKRIIANGDEIVFLTDGCLEKEDVEKFFKEAYGINKLPEGTEYIRTKCNRGANGRRHDKKGWLDRLHDQKGIPKKDIVFVDNSSGHIREATQLGVTAIHAKTNACHEPAVVKKAAWLSDLEQNVCERTLARAVPVLGTTVIGAATGALMGATIGTACGGVGALPGAIIGGLLGAVIGYFAPQWITSCCCCCSSNEFEMAARAEFPGDAPDAASVPG